jgi:hypothetical protein
MHALSSSFILGYHGCDAKVGENILGGTKLKPSSNDYDWLGHGIYFWEANPQRGLDFARELKEAKRGKAKVEKPFVIGAVIDLRLCLDLTTLSGIEQVRSAYRGLRELVAVAGGKIPQNNPDGLRRPLDCAVVNFLHIVREQNGEPPIDTIKGVFTEGGPAYEGSGFQAKTHVQICVRNSECIKGVFRVPPSDL